MHKFLIAAALVAATAIPAFAAERGETSFSVNKTASAVARPNTQVSAPSRPVSTPSVPTRPTSSIPSIPAPRR